MSQLRLSHELMLRLKREEGKLLINILSIYFLSAHLSYLSVTGAGSVVTLYVECRN